MDKKFLIYVFQTLYLVTRDKNKAQRFVQRQARCGNPVTVKVV